MISKKHLPALLLMAWLVASFACLTYANRTERADFEAQYYGAVRVTTGQAATLYEYQTYPGNLPYTRAAWEVLLYVPLAFLSYRAAFLAWFPINLAIFGLAMWLLRDEIKALSPNRRLILTLFLIFPLGRDLIVGQDSSIFLLLTVLAYRALKNQQEARSGVFLGLASFKPHLLIPVFIFLVIRGRWRALASAAAVGLGLLIVSTLVAGPHWIGNCLEAQASVSHATGTSTLRGLLDLAGLSSLALPCILLGLTCTLWALRRSPLHLALPYLFAATVVLNWHAYLYDYLAAVTAFVVTPLRIQVEAANRLEYLESLQKV